MINLSSADNLNLFECFQFQQSFIGCVQQDDIRSGYFLFQLVQSFSRQF